MHPATTFTSSSRRRSRATSLGRLIFGGVIAGSVALGATSVFAQSTGYVQTNLISDGAVPAKTTDPGLINPWGVSIGTSFWIDSPGSGLSLVDDASGNKDFQVSIPAATPTAAHGSPAGTVFNANANAFLIPSQGSASFVFGGLDGAITAWNANTPEAVIVANNSSAGAVYTDIAIDTNSSGTFLLAANFAKNTVDVFDTNFHQTQLAGGFTDPAIPQGYAPFGIHFLNNQVFVTYAEVNPTNGREVVGAGLGFVDVYDTQGNLIKQVIAGGNLNAPWGMALAPSGFGTFGGDLLVGNFGDGLINAYDPSSFAFKGTLQDGSGNPIANPGLWEIVFGQNGVGDSNTLYIAAGINDGKDGLFASVAAAAPSTTSGDFSLQAPTSPITVAAGQSGTLQLTLAGSNGFSGPVTFSCSGLPTGASCSFNPPTLQLSGTQSATVSVTIATAASTTPPPTSPYDAGLLTHHPAMALGFLTPFGLLLLARGRRRTFFLQSLVVAGAFVGLGFTAVGCSGSTPQQSSGTTTTPPTNPTTQVTITATSGSLSHSTVVDLTVQ